MGDIHILTPRARAKSAVQKMADSAVAFLKQAGAEQEATAEKNKHRQLVDQELDLAMRKACVILGNEDGEKHVFAAVERMRKWMEGR
jgi:hypothetical protein